MDQSEAVLTLGERGWQEMWGYVRKAHKILEEARIHPEYKPYWRGQNVNRVGTTNWVSLCR